VPSSSTVKELKKNGLLDAEHEDVIVPLKCLDPPTQGHGATFHKHWYPEFPSYLAVRCDSKSVKI
jgi:hypothetical protein